MDGVDLADNSISSGSGLQLRWGNFSLSKLKALGSASAFFALICIFGIACYIEINDRNKASIVAAQKVNIATVTFLTDLVDHSVEDARFLATKVALLAPIERFSESDFNKIAQDFIALGESTESYKQIRYIDTDGVEVVRVDFRDNSAFRVDSGSLQNKSDRYYFKEGMRLSQSQVFMTPLDLNMEHGSIEKPYVPVVRFVLPVFDAKGVKQGLIVLNYLRTKLLDKVAVSAIESDAQLTLVNSNGYWLSPPSDTEGWGGMFARPPGFSSYFSNDWPLIKASAEAVVKTERGVLISTRLSFPDKFSASELVKLADDQSWYVISILNAADLSTNRLVSIKRLSLFFLPILVLMLLLHLSFRQSLKKTELKSQQLGDQVAASEARFDLVTETASDAIITIDSDQLIVYWNPAAERIFGYPKEEIIGQPISSLIPKPWRAQHHEKFQQACANGCIQTDDEPKEVTALRKNGEPFPIELSMSMRESQGKYFFTSFIRDITQRLEHESTIRTLSMAVEQSPVSIVIANLSGEIIYVNEAFSHISGYDMHEVLGKNPRMFQSGEMCDSVYEALWSNITQGKSWEGEILNRKKNGALFWEYARISPVKSASGAISHYMAIKEDISALKKSTQDLSTSLRLRKILSACNQSLVRSESEAAFLTQICQSIVTQGGYAFVWVGYADDAIAQTIRVEATAGDDQGYLGTFDDVARGAHIPGDVIRMRRHLLGRPALNSSTADLQQQGLEDGFNSTIALPVVDEALGLYAVLRIYSKNLLGFSDEEQELLLELAEDLRFGIVSHRTRIALEESAVQFRSLSEDSLVGVYMIRDEKLVYANPKMADIFGFSSSDEMIGLPAVELITPDDRSNVLRTLREKLNRRSPSINYQFTGERQSGEKIQIEIFGAITRSGGCTAVVGSLWDITERNQQMEHLRVLQRALESSNEGVAIADYRVPDTPLVYVNPAFETLTGFSESEVLGRNGGFLLGDSQYQPALDTLRESITLGRAVQVELQSQRKNGSMYWCELSLAPVFDDQAELTHYVSIVQDVTDRRYYTQELERLTHFDTLTGLANRTLLQDRLTQALSNGQRSGRRSALIIISINRFDTLSQTLNSDELGGLIVALGQRLTSRVRKGDTVARTGTEQFAVLLDNLQRDCDVSALALELRDDGGFFTPFGPEGLHIELTMGLTVAPVDGDTADQLLRNAQAALIQARASKDDFCFFKPQMNIEARKRQSLETDLRRAVDEGQFVVFYQPKIRLQDGQVVGAEALIRWQHPTQGLIFPDAFIPLAEDTGLIRSIGDWVLQEACHFVANLNSALAEPIAIAVNFSVEQFKQTDLCSKVAKALRESGLPAHLLECELTESLLMRDPEGAVHALNAIKSLGAFVALDDFGTGYSSLSYLKRFPIDTLKIDRSFVMDIPHDESDMAIVKAVIALANALDMHVVAEGVETQEQAKFLRQLGCQSVQGYYFSMPISAENFAALINRRECYQIH